MADPRQRTDAERVRATDEAREFEACRFAADHFGKAASWETDDDAVAPVGYAKKTPASAPPLVWNSVPVPRARDALKRIMVAGGMKSAVDIVLDSLATDDSVMSGSAVLAAIVMAQTGRSVSWTPGDVDIWIRLDAALNLGQKLLAAGMVCLRDDVVEYIDAQDTIVSSSGVVEYGFGDGTDGGGSDGSMRVQLIVHDKRPLTCLDQFDFPLVMNHFDGEEVYMTKESEAAIAQSTLGLPSVMYIKATYLGPLGKRMIKYADRGFGIPQEIYMPRFHEHDRHVAESLEAMADFVKQYYTMVPMQSADRPDYTVYVLTQAGGGGRLVKGVAGAGAGAGAAGGGD